MRILGIETSCDETAVAIYDSDAGLLAHQLYSQAAQHAKFGGVVPELASRDHVRKLVPLVTAALREAHAHTNTIDAVAYTAGPGLLGALLVGASMAQGLAYAWRVPALGIHHLEGHLLAPMLEARAPAFPFVALLVSGGHTLLARIAGVGQYTILGQSLDDAAGEAFDKTAKLLGLPYPGGPALAALAESGCSTHFQLPRPMLDRPGLDFSFSGLKTAVMTTLRASNDDTQARADLAAAFQEAVVDTLAAKCTRALDETGETRLVVAGGVGANRALRARLAQLMAERGGEVYYPRLEFCTDNAAMIAYAGAQRFRQAATAPGGGVRARWPLDSLTAPHC